MSFSADLGDSYLSEIQGALENSEEGFLRAREIQVVVETVNKVKFGIGS